MPNDRRVGDHVLDPASTYYHDGGTFGTRARVLYVGHEVTDLLRPGSNALGVMLGHGWYSAEADIPPAPAHYTPYDEQPVLRLQMNIAMPDGGTIYIASDESWKASPGPILYNNYSHGEIYDARRGQPGWCDAGFDDSGWSAARPVPGPDGRLEAQILPPSKVVQTLAPVQTFNPSEGVYVFDFGQAFTGWCRLKVEGPAGTRVTLKHGMGVYDDGSLDHRSNWNDRFPRHTARQMDTYILKGDGPETWEPRFTLHGFRYVEVTGYPGTPTLDCLEGRHVRTAAAPAGDFTCSNDLLNRIHSNVWWTLASSLQGFPQDAADRSERVGWTGDVNIAEDYDLNFDLAGFWTKWLDDLRDAQRADGRIPCVCPTHWRETLDPYNASPVWQGVYPVVCFQTYLDYDDERVLIENYEGMKRLVDYFGRELATDHIIPSGIGDHMEPQPDGTTSPTPQYTPPALTSTAWYYRITRIVAEAAKLAGNDAEHRRYTALAEEIRAAFNRAFFDAERGYYATGSQTANAVPLRLGMVPEEHIPTVVAHLVDDIINTHHGHLTTGFLGIDALAAALPEHGAAAALYALATQETFPSWGYMIAQGATTVWESWDGNQEVDYSSLNMKLHGGIDKFFYQGLAGIRRTAPGYREFAIRPGVVGDLTGARARVQTVRGAIESAWCREATDGSFRLRAVVPPNSSASISVPVRGDDGIIREGSETVWEDGRFVVGPAGIASAHRDGNCVTFTVGSGRYLFTTG